MNSPVTLKATPFLAIVGFMSAELPPAAWEKILGRLAPRYADDSRRLAERKVLASDTFSLSFATELIEQVAAELGQPAEAIAYEIGRRGAEAATGTVLRFVFALVSMSSYLGKIQAVWSKLYSHGHVTYVVNGKSANVEVHDFPFVSTVNCARITGSLNWFAARAEKTGAVRHVQCRGRGEEACRWLVTW